MESCSLLANLFPKNPNLGKGPHGWKMVGALLKCLLSWSPFCPFLRTGSSAFLLNRPVSFCCLQSQSPGRNKRVSSKHSFPWLVPSLFLLFLLCLWLWLLGRRCLMHVGSNPLSHTRRVKEVVHAVLPGTAAPAYGSGCMFLSKAALHTRWAPISAWCEGEQSTQVSILWTASGSETSPWESLAVWLFLKVLVE